jgi:proteasome assembly chaperone (PAC2) family protein
MGETSGYLVDPKSAASVLAVLCPLIGIAVDPTRLKERAAEIEQVIAAMVESEEKKGEEELRYIG